MKTIRSILLPAAAILLGAAWVYAPAIRGDWIWDDQPEVTQNRMLRDPAGLTKIWFAPDSPDYFPLKGTVQWIQWHLWQDHPAGYHLTNVALHVLSAFLLWNLLRRLGVRLAWLGGLLFAVHPLAIESVAWIAELKNALSLPFLLLALGAAIDYDERRRRGDYARSLLWYMAAVLSKSSVVMFPAVLLLHAWWKRGRLSRADWVASAPFFAVSLILGGITVWFQEHRAIAGVGLLQEGLVSRAVGAGMGFGFYLAKCLWPSGLLPIYPRWRLDPPSWPEVIPWLALAGLVGWLWTNRATWGRHALFGLGWFGLNLVPVLGLVPMAYLRIAWVADHFAYLSLAGAMGLVAAGLGRLLSTAGPFPPFPRSVRAVVGVGTAIAVVALASAGHRYAGIFRDEETFWNTTLQHNPQAWAAHNDLGRVLFVRGRIAEAKAHFERSLQLNPENAEAHFNLGLILNGLDQPDAAVQQFEEAVRLRPFFPEAHHSLGQARLRSGRLTEAIAQFEAELRFRPDSPEAHDALGAALAESGRIPEAIGE